MLIKLYCSAVGRNYSCLIDREHQVEMDWYNLCRWETNKQNIVVLIFFVLFCYGLPLASPGACQRSASYSV